MEENLERKINLQTQIYLNPRILVMKKNNNNSNTKDEEQ